MAQVLYNSERVNPDKCLLTLWWCVYKRNLFCLLSAVEWLSHGSCPQRWVFLMMPRLLHHVLGGRCFEEWGELCVASPISCSLLLPGIRWNHGQHWAISWISPKFLIGVQAGYSYCTTGIVVALSAATTSVSPVTFIEVGSLSSQKYLYLLQLVICVRVCICFCSTARAFMFHFTDC